MLPFPSNSALRAPLGDDRRAAGRVHPGAVLAVIVVAAVVAWLLVPDGPELVGLGPAEALVTRDGVSTFLALRPGGDWELLTDTATGADPQVVRLAGVRGRPALHPEGHAVFLNADGLVVVGSESGLLVPADRLPADARLAGVAGQDRELVVLQHGFADGTHGLLTVAFDDTGAPRPIRPLLDEEGAPVRIPDDGGLLVNPFHPAIAFRGADGWEAWAFEPVGLGDLNPPSPQAVGTFASHEFPSRVVAEGLATRALFAPDGVHLVVEDAQAHDLHTSSLKLLSMKDGGVAFMSHGNLGHSRRVPDSHDFRGDPLLLVNPRWHREGYLQIFSHHFLGGGQSQFKVAFFHHYALSISEDGDWMAYCQSDFDEDGDDAFSEDLYVLDFGEPSRGALHLGRRAGGRPDVGPRFVGRDPVLVVVMDGELKLARLGESRAP